MVTAYTFPKDEIMNPLAYAKVRLGLDLYDWQQKAIWSVAKREKVALKAANESGKTSKVAVSLVFWLMESFENALVVVTSGSWTQLIEQFMPALRRHTTKFPEWIFNDTTIKAPNGSRLVCVSTNDAGRFEGFHALDPMKSPLMIIVDEAKSVDDPIFTAVDRCGAQYLLIMSSPGAPSGQFYRCFTKDKELFSRYTVTSFDCPHIPESKRNEDRIKYGEESPIFRSMHLAAFTEDDSESVITLSNLENLFRNPPREINDGEVSAFCDFAAGGDENVLAIRRGNKVSIAKAWREKDTMKAIAQFITLFVTENLKPHQITGDDGGLGKVMIDALTEAGWAINRFNFGSASTDDHYVNAGAEIWFKGARAIERREVILPANEDLKDQLLGRRRKYNKNGKLGLESKEEIRSRGGSSPDRADAVLGTLLKPRSTAPINYLTHTSHSKNEGDCSWF